MWLRGGVRSVCELATIMSVILLAAICGYPLNTVSPLPPPLPLPPGPGVLAVVRSHPLEPQPYTGMVPIVSGEVAEDLANYLVRSRAVHALLVP